MTYDQHGVEDASRALLEAVGEDITREGLRDTPSRMGRAWRELLSGLEEDPRDHLKTTFEVGRTKSSWSVISPSIPCVSITFCLSTDTRTSATSRRAVA